ncbi:MAG: hypothetical protein J6O55_05265 [Lachnospiraceae bacterium]|nr:hypothetical protein [Lachnospiraceae bacterium]
MPPLRDKSGDRSSQIREYYQRNYENKTTAEIVDFMGGIHFADTSVKKLISTKELNELTAPFLEYMLPLKRDENGKSLLDKKGNRSLCSMLNLRKWGYPRRNWMS